jgi:hypothetical protein
MLALIVAFVLGMIVMDLLWAWKMGIPQRMWHRFKHRNDPRPDYSQWTED